MLGEAMKEYWTLVSAARRTPSGSVFTQIILKSKEHPNGKVRALYAKFVKDTRNVKQQPLTA